MQRILLIEDEPNIRELVAYNLKAGGFDPLLAEDGTEGMDLAVSERPDLILLDIMLPGKNGFDICRELRQAGNRTPIIMLTAKNEEIDKVLGLEFGADDYISKPFGVRELIARIKAVLRRTGEAAHADSSAGGREETAVSGREGDETAGRIEAGELIIDMARHEVTVGGRLVELTLKEFDLLAALAANRGIVLSRDQLLDRVWGFEYIGETRTVDVHVRYLRKKLGDDEREGRYIRTVRGVGYKMP